MFALAEPSKSRNPDENSENMWVSYTLFEPQSTDNVQIQGQGSDAWEVFIGPDKIALSGSSRCRHIRSALPTRTKK